MKLNPRTITAALLTALALASAPAVAQERDHGRPDGTRTPSQDSRARGERAQPRSESTAPRATAPAPRVEAQAPRIDSPRADTRGYDVGRAVPRTQGVPRGDQRYNGDRRYDAGRYDSRGYAPHYGYSARPYYRPYVFRPRISIGFGIFAGYPVPYTYSYGYPIRVYGYRAPYGPVVVGPGSPLYGGIALEITPYDAQVFVDGSYAGLVQDFDGSRQPLTLAAGTHRIEVEAPGLAPLVMDVAIQPGQVIPYRGDMRPY